MISGYMQRLKLICSIITENGIFINQFVFIVFIVCFFQQNNLFLKFVQLMLTRNSLIIHMNEQEKRRKFEQFFIMSYPKVKAFAWKILKSEDDAEDIAQDVFVKLWDNPDIWGRMETWDS